VRWRFLSCYHCSPEFGTFKAHSPNIPFLDTRKPLLSINLAEALLWRRRESNLRPTSLRDNLRSVITIEMLRPQFPFECCVSACSYTETNRRLGHF